MVPTALPRSPLLAWHHLSTTHTAPGTTPRFLWQLPHGPRAPGRPWGCLSISFPPRLFSQSLKGSRLTSAKGMSVRSPHSIPEVSLYRTLTPADLRPPGSVTWGDPRGLGSNLSSLWEEAPLSPKCHGFSTVTGRGFPTASRDRLAAPRPAQPCPVPEGLPCLDHTRVVPCLISGRPRSRARDRGPAPQVGIPRTICPQFLSVWKWVLVQLPQGPVDGAPRALSGLHSPALCIGFSLPTSSFEAKALPC